MQCLVDLAVGVPVLALSLLGGSSSGRTTSSPAELRRLLFDPADSTIAHNLSAMLRFDSPCLYCAWRYAGLRAAPTHNGQQVGPVAALPELTQRRGTRGGDARHMAWAGTQRVLPGHGARAGGGRGAAQRLRAST